MNVLRRVLFASCAFVSVWMLAIPTASALPAGLSPYEMSFEGAGLVYGLDELPTSYERLPNDMGGTYTLQGPLTVSDQGVDLFRVNGWSSTYDVDPFVTNNLNVTNLSGVPQIFTVTVTSPVVATGPQTAMTGSVGITFTNTTAAAGDGVSTSGVSAYTAYIDGNAVQTLFDDPSSVTCAAAFCSNTQNQSFGVFPAPPLLGPAATTDIGIQIRFVLSPGDSAAVTSVFNIEAIPEPMTALLLGGGLVGLAAFGRKRD